MKTKCCMLYTLIVCLFQEEKEKKKNYYDSLTGWEHKQFNVVFLHLYLIYLKWPTVFGGLQLDKQKCEEYMTKSRLKDLFPLHSTSM